MPKVAINTKSSDFSLKTINGKTFTLSDLEGKKHVLLVFNRGLM